MTDKKKKMGEKKYYIDYQKRGLCEMGLYVKGLTAMPDTSRYYNIF